MKAYMSEPEAELVDCDKFVVSLSNNNFERSLRASVTQ